jgi:hypothetical protein
VVGRFAPDFNLFEVLRNGQPFRHGSEPSGFTETEIKKEGPVSRSQVFNSTYEPNISLFKAGFSGSSDVAWLPLATVRKDDEGTIH